MPRQPRKKVIKKLTHYMNGKVKCTLDTLREISDKSNFDQIVSILKKSFQQDLNVEEACLEAGIRKSTFYCWCNASDEFSNSIAQAKQRLRVTAKKTVAASIEKKDIEITKWWLERRAKDEFATKTETDNKNQNFNQEVTIDIDPN